MGRLGQGPEVREKDWFLSFFNHSKKGGRGEKGMPLGQVLPSFPYLSSVGWPMSTPTSRDSNSFWRRVTILAGAPGAAVAATTVTSFSLSGQCSAR